jgi:hypothetical protein
MRGSNVAALPRTFAAVVPVQYKHRTLAAPQTLCIHGGIFSSQGRNVWELL